MSDRPKPRQQREPVFRADDEPDLASFSQGAKFSPPTENDGLPTDPAEREALRQRLIAQGALQAPPGDEADISAAAYLPPEPSREPIATAPQDGSHFLAYWGTEDEIGRLVRWRQGRHFNGRRWAPGGGWAPADGMIPLPAVAPTEWLKPPESQTLETAEEEAA